MSRRRHLRLMRFVAVALLAALLTGCGVGDLLATDDSSPGRSDSGSGRERGQKFSTGPQWSDYMPTQDGLVCTYSGTQTFDSSGAEDLGYGELPTREITTTEKVGYSNVREESDGTHFVLESITERTSDVLQYEDGRTEDGLSEYAEPWDPIRQEYLLASDGTLRFELEDFAASGSMTPGLSYETDADDLVTLPPLGDLREGESYAATTTTLVRGTDPESQAELEEDLQSGESAMEVRMDYTVERLPPKEITTPTGPFTDVVGISLAFDTFEYPNASDERRRELDEASESLSYDLGARTIEWYARDVGPVSKETVFEVGEDVEPEATIGGMDWQEGDTLDGFPPMKLEGCDSEQQSSGFEQFVGEWYVHGTQMIINADSTGVQTSNAGPCTDPFESGGSEAMCNTVTQLEFSEDSSGGVTATITSIDHETWEGGSPPAGFEPDETVRVGDSFRLEFADDNLLRSTWLGRLDHLNEQFNPYWCNSQTSDENRRQCGA